MKRAILVGMLGVVMGQGTAATPPLVLQTPLPETARVEQIVGEDVVRRWDDVRIEARTIRMDSVAIRTAVWEVRTADGMQRVASLPLKWKIDSQEVEVEAAEVFTLDANQVSALWKGGDGEFVAAWVIDGERRSNVVKVKVDSKHAAKEEPVLRVTVAEPAVAGRLPLVAVVAARGQESDPSPEASDLAFAQWTIDGTRLQGGGLYRGGSAVPLAVGKSCAWAESLEADAVRVPVGQEHRVVVKVGETSATAVIGVGTPLGDAWDAATARLDAEVATQTRPAK